MLLSLVVEYHLVSLVEERAGNKSSTWLKWSWTDLRPGVDSVCEALV